MEEKSTDMQSKQCLDIKDDTIEIIELKEELVEKREIKEIDNEEKQIKDNHVEIIEFEGDVVEKENRDQYAEATEVNQVKVDSIEVIEFQGDVAENKEVLEQRANCIGDETNKACHKIPEEDKNGLYTTVEEISKDVKMEPDSEAVQEQSTSLPVKESRKSKKKNKKKRN